jgi:hypothetical protein
MGVPDATPATYLAALDLVGPKPEAEIVAEMVAVCDEVRAYEATDPSFPKRQIPTWNPGGRGKFRTAELRRWVAGNTP